jgi:hypothetical protein
MEQANRHGCIGRFSSIFFQISRRYNPSTPSIIVSGDKWPLNPRNSTRQHASSRNRRKRGLISLVKRDFSWGLWRIPLTIVSMRDFRPITKWVESGVNRKGDKFNWENPNFEVRIALVQDIWPMAILSTNSRMTSPIEKFAFPNPCVFDGSGFGFEFAFSKMKNSDSNSLWTLSSS